MAVIQPWTTNKNINGFGLNTNTPKATPPPRTGPVAAPGQSTLNFAPEPQGPPPVNNQPVLEVPTPSMSVNTQKPEAANAIANAAAQVPRVVQGIGQGVIDIATGVGSGFVDMARTNPKDVTSLPGGATPAPAQAAIQKGLETQSNAVVQWGQNATSSLQQAADAVLPEPITPAAEVISKGAQVVGEAIPNVGAALVGGPLVAGGIGATQVYGSERIGGATSQEALGPAIAAGIAEGIGAKVFNEGGALGKLVGESQVGARVLDAVGEGFEENLESILQGQKPTLEEFGYGAVAGAILGPAVGAIQSEMHKAAETKETKSWINDALSGGAAVEIFSAIPGTPGFVIGESRSEAPDTPGGPTPTAPPSNPEGPEGPGGTPQTPVAPSSPTAGADIDGLGVPDSSSGDSYSGPPVIILPEGGPSLDEIVQPKVPVSVGPGTLEADALPGIDQTSASDIGYIPDQNVEAGTIGVDQEVDKLNRPLTGMEQGAVQSYKGWSANLNNALRSKEGLTGAAESFANWARYLDSAFEAGELSEDSILHRGSSLRTFEATTGLKLSNLEPFEIEEEMQDIYQFTDKGFLSTSKDPAVARSFRTRSGGSVNYTIRAPAGVKSLDFTEIKGARDSEQEIVFPRGTTYQVNDAYYDEDADIYDVDLSVVAPESVARSQEPPAVLKSEEELAAGRSKGFNETYNDYWSSHLDEWTQHNPGKPFVPLPSTNSNGAQMQLAPSGPNTQTAVMDVPYQEQVEIAEPLQLDEMSQPDVRPTILENPNLPQQVQLDPQVQTTGQATTQQVLEMSPEATFRAQTQTSTSPPSPPTVPSTVANVEMPELPQVATQVEEDPEVIANAPQALAQPQTLTQTQNWGLNLKRQELTTREIAPPNAQVPTTTIAAQGFPEPNSPNSRQEASEGRAETSGIFRGLGANGEVYATESYNRTFGGLSSG